MDSHWSVQWLRLEKAAPKAPAEPAPADPKGGKKKEAVEAKVFRAVETITDQLQNDLRKVKEAVLAKRYAVMPSRRKRSHLARTATSRPHKA